MGQNRVPGNKTPWVSCQENALATLLLLWPQTTALITFYMLHLGEAASMVTKTTAQEPRSGAKARPSPGLRLPGHKSRTALASKDKGGEGNRAGKSRNPSDRE